MITYVNTVLVSNLAGAVIYKPTKEAPLESATNDANDHAGKFIVFDVDNGVYADSADGLNRIKIGLITSKNTVKIDKTGARKYVPVIKWSNVIKKEDLKSYSVLDYSKYTAAAVEAEDTVEIDFTSLNPDVLASFQQGGKRIIVRLTFKDMPTRFRKWTESYEYVTKKNDSTETIATGIANLINKQWKRARVIASTDASKVILKAMPYDDDNSVDTINVANKVRFTANIYYTNPDAAAFASNNKYFPTGVTLTKKNGVIYPAEAKLVRDHEAQAMGYEGILNRGCCTWPIIKPEMQVDLSVNYDAYTLEFENSYRSADDLTRRTKQTLEVFVKTGAAAESDAKTLSALLNAFAAEVKTPETTYKNED